MKTGGFRYALRRSVGERWVTVASSDDLPLIDKMFTDQAKGAHAHMQLVDVTIDKVLRHHHHLGPVDRNREVHPEGS